MASTSAARQISKAQLAYYRLPNLPFEGGGFISLVQKSLSFSLDDIKHMGTGDYKEQGKRPTIPHGIPNSIIQCT